MNACGARLELGYDRPILSSLHAGYSIAGLAGAGIGGISAWLGISPLPTFIATAGALIVLGLLAGPRQRRIGVQALDLRGRRVENVLVRLQPVEPVFAEIVSLGESSRIQLPPVSREHLS